MEPLNCCSDDAILQCVKRVHMHSRSTRGFIFSFGVCICTVVHVNCVDKKKEERNMYIRNKNKKRSEWIDDASVPTAHPHFPVQSYIIFPPQHHFLTGSTWFPTTSSSGGVLNRHLYPILLQPQNISAMFSRQTDSLKDKISIEM